jgi:type IV pilus assembly protein PilE
MSRQRLARHSIASRGRGFTLIELLVALVIAGILGMVALPAFNESVRKSRRSEAFAALALLQQAQERWRGNNAEYTTSLTQLALAETTPGGYYTISVTAASEDAGALATGYIATATAVSSKSQASDSACSTMSVRLVGGNLAYAGAAGTFSASNPCWAQ